MTQTMNRSKVQILLMLDLQQTEAQSPGYMLQISSRRAGEKESVKSSKDRQPRRRCQTCLKHENGKRAKDSTEADPPTARYQARSAKTAAFSRKAELSNK